MDSKRKRQHDAEPEAVKSRKKAKSTSVSERSVPALAADSEMTTVVTSASQSLESKIFHKLLTTVLLPVAEASLTQEQKDNIMLVFKKSITEHGGGKQDKQAISLIDYKRYSSSLASSVYSLELSARGVHAHDNYDEQGEIMDEMACEMLEWFQKLFRVGIEMQVQFELVHKSLKAVKSTIDDCAVDFGGDVDALKSSTGKVMYEQGFADDFLHKLWRDLFLVAIGKGGQENEKFVKAAIKSLDQKTRTSVAGVLPEDESGKPHYKRLDNGWHTPEMIGAIPRLRDLLTSKKGLKAPPRDIVRLSEVSQGTDSPRMHPETTPESERSRSPPRMTARKSTGGKAPRKQLATEPARKTRAPIS